MINDLIGAWNILIQTDDGKLAFPPILEKAGDVGRTSLPLRRSKRFHAGFVLRRENQKRRSGLQCHVGKASLENRAHLLKLASDSFGVSNATVRQHTKVRAADFGPGSDFRGTRATANRQDTHKGAEAKTQHGPPPLMFARRLISAGSGRNRPATRRRIRGARPAGGRLLRPCCSVRDQRAARRLTFRRRGVR